MFCGTNCCDSAVKTHQHLRCEKCELGTGRHHCLDLSNSNDSNISQERFRVLPASFWEAESLSKEQLGTTWNPLFLLFIPFDYQFPWVSQKQLPGASTQLASQDRVTHFGHGQKSQFQVRAMEEILPRLQLQCFCWLEIWRCLPSHKKHVNSWNFHMPFYSHIIPIFILQGRKVQSRTIYDYHIGFWISERRTTRVASACCSPASCCSSFISCSRSKLQFQRAALHKENLWQGPFMVQIAFQPHWHLCIMASMAAKPDQNYGNLVL